MTRFSFTAMALLLALPAAADPAPVRILPSQDNDGTCLNLNCYGVKHLRDLYRRGEIADVRLNTRNECRILNWGLGPEVPCTVIYPNEK